MAARTLRCRHCGETLEVLGAVPPQGRACPKCRKPLGPAPRPRPAREAAAPAETAAAPGGPAARKKKLLILAGAGGGALVLLVVILVVALSGPSKPPPAPPEPAAKAPDAAAVAKEKARRAALKEEWERASEAAAAARKDPALAARSAALLEKFVAKAAGTEHEAGAKSALEEIRLLVPKPGDEKIAAEVRALVDQGQLRGAATLMRTYLADAATSPALRASLESLGRRVAELAPPRYDALVQEARAIAAAGRLAEARLKVLDAAGWGVPEIAERATRDAEAWAPAPAATAKAPEAAPAEAPKTPEEKPAAPEPAKEPEKPAAAPDPAAAGKTGTASAPGVKLITPRAPREGAFKPGGLADAEKQKKHADLMAELRKEKKGAAKAAAAKRAEWLAGLEKEKGVYDVTTFVDKGDVAKRVDVVIVTSGFPKADGRKVDQMCEQLKTALLKVDPFQNYPDYINFHRIKIDDARNAGGARIPYQVQNDILTADFGKGLEYARLAPSFDLVVVLCNVSNVRATGGPPFITIDASLDLGRTFLHEMGHAFAALSDEYVDASIAPGRPFREDEDSEWQTNVTAQKNPRLSKWHYWTMDVWPAPHEMNRRPPDHKVGAFEGAAYQAAGVYRPESECLMRMGDKYCVVCFEHVEKRFYRLIAPIDDARPRKSLLGLWGDDTVVLEGDAIRTVASGGQVIGKFEGLWYLDAKPTGANSKNLTTALTLKGSELGAGVHEAALRVDFSNKRVRRDHGWLSSSIGWKLDVLKHKRPKWEAPAAAVQGRVGMPLEFDAKIENPDPQAFRVEVRDLPEGAVYENGKVRWTPGKEHQGAWRPRFALTDGLRVVERAVDIGVLDTAEKNFEPVFSLMEPVSAAEGEALELALEVVDVDGDSLVFSSPNLPEGAELDVHEGVIRWKPGLRQAGRYAGIQVEVADGRRKVKGTVEIVVEDKPTRGFAKDDLLNALRSGNGDVRLKALGELGSGAYAKSFQFMEAARLLRDKDPEVKEAALAALRKIQEGADGPFLAMMIRDLEPHAWHFTDDRTTLAWLDELASKGAPNDKDVKELKGALKGIAKYNQDRGAP